MTDSEEGTVCCRYPRGWRRSPWSWELEGVWVLPARFWESEKKLAIGIICDQN